MIWRFFGAELSVLLSVFSSPVEESAVAQVAVIPHDPFFAWRKNPDHPARTNGQGGQDYGNVWDDGRW
jgi:hypothetical protein